MADDAIRVRLFHRMDPEIETRVARLLEREQPGSVVVGSHPEVVVPGSPHRRTRLRKDAIRNIKGYFLPADARDFLTGFVQGAYGGEARAAMDYAARSGARLQLFPDDGMVRFLHCIVPHEIKCEKYAAHVMALGEMTRTNVAAAMRRAYALIDAEQERADHFLERLNGWQRSSECAKPIIEAPGALILLPYSSEALQRKPLYGLPTASIDARADGQVPLPRPQTIAQQAAYR